MLLDPVRDVPIGKGDRDVRAMDLAEEFPVLLAVSIKIIRIKTLHELDHGWRQLWRRGAGDTRRCSDSEHRDERRSASKNSFAHDELLNAWGPTGRGIGGATGCDACGFQPDQTAAGCRLSRTTAI